MEHYGASVFSAGAGGSASSVHVILRRARRTCCTALTEVLPKKVVAQPACQGGGATGAPPKVCFECRNSEVDEQELA